MTLPDHHAPPVGVRNPLAALPPKPQTPSPGLGRVRLPNPGSLKFPLAAALPATALSPFAWKTKRWVMGKGLSWSSQGTLSQCVYWNIAHAHMITPVIRPNAFTVLKGLYEWAQAHDPWPGGEPAYFGTSVDAGLQYCRKIAKTVSEYRWARSMDEVLGRLSVAAKDGGGPLVLGADFYMGMTNENGDGIWHPTGELLGGHCFLAIGHEAPNAKRGRSIILGNSHDGNFVGKMPADEFEWLIFAQGGEAAAVTELAK